LQRRTVGSVNVDGDGGRGTAGKLAGVLAVVLLAGALLAVLFVGGRLLWVSLRGSETSPPVEASAGQPVPPASGESFANAPRTPAAAGLSAGAPGNSLAAQPSTPEPSVPGASSSDAPGTSVPAKPSTGTATGSIRLAWDKSPDENVPGYQILFGTQPGNYSRSVDVRNQTTAKLTGLERATKYYVVVTALDAQGNQSGPSNELEIVVAR
jgi:Fibronectin type III domain